jgi:hypothetical protein
MGVGEDKTPRVYKDVPFDLVLRLCQLYDSRDKWDESSPAYEEYTEKIQKVKTVLEYIATGGVN